MDYYRINQPDGPHVLTGDWFVKSDKQLVARTSPTPSAPFFVAERLTPGGWSHIQLSVWVVTPDGNGNAPDGELQEVALCKAHVCQPAGGAYHICQLLNDDFWASKKSGLAEGMKVLK